MYDPTKCPYSSQYRHDNGNWTQVKEQVVGKARDKYVYIMEYFDGRDESFVVKCEHDYKGLLESRAAKTIEQAEVYFREMVRKYQSQG